jgi:hypothetical protein
VSPEFIGRKVMAKMICPRPMVRIVIFDAYQSQILSIVITRIVVDVVYIRAEARLPADAAHSGVSLLNFSPARLGNPYSR